MFVFQVATRFIASSCPVMYWFIAHITTPEDQFKPVAGAAKPDLDAASKVKEDTPDQSKPVMDLDGDKAAEAAEDLLDWDNSSLFKQAILVYFHLYMFVGIAAFSNSLPWT